MQLVCSAAAALGLRVTCETRLPTHFPECGLLLIATDLSPTMLPSRVGVLLLDLESRFLASTGALVGMAGDERDVVTNLVSRVAPLLGREPRSQIVGVSSAAGGLGLTTLIALLGISSARSGRSTLVIEQSTRLLRILGAKGVATNYELITPELKKVGVLSEDVIVTPSLLQDASTRFDSVIFGLAYSGTEPVNVRHSLRLTANTALALEGIPDQIAPTRVLVRQMSYGTLSPHQVAAMLRKHDVCAWPDDPQLAIAADFGDLNRAKRANSSATDIWLSLVGGRIER
jgi:hypothetical protein